MKKIIFIALSLLLFASLTVSVSAEEFNGEDLFTIDVPEGFEQKGAMASDFYFEKENGDNFTVTYSDNAEAEELFCPKDFSKKELESYGEDICRQAEEAMAEYAKSFDMSVISAEKKEHPDSTVMSVITFKTEVTKDEKNNVYYQKLCEFGGINYKYSFSFTTTEEERINDFDGAFETIDIFEAYVRSGGENAAVYILAAVMALLIVGGIVRFIRTPEKRKQGKIK